MVQEKYAPEVVSRYGMGDAKIVSTPFEPGSTFGSVDELDQERVDPGMVDVPYRNLVGSLMYLAVCTRPDLSMVSACKRSVAEIRYNDNIIHTSERARVSP